MDENEELTSSSGSSIGSGRGLSVVICAHNETSVIGETLIGLLPQLRLGAIEIVVIANGCTDGTEDVVRSFAGVKLLTSPIPSKVKALNMGDAASSHFPRVYLDADIRIEGSDLVALADEMVLRG